MCCICNLGLPRDGRTELIHDIIWAYNGTEGEGRKEAPGLNTSGETRATGAVEGSSDTNTICPPGERNNGTNGLVTRYLHAY